MNKFNIKMLAEQKILWSMLLTGVELFAIAICKLDGSMLMQKLILSPFKSKFSSTINILYRIQKKFMKNYFAKNDNILGTKLLNLLKA